MGKCCIFLLPKIKISGEFRRFCLDAAVELISHKMYGINFESKKRRLLKKLWMT